MFTINTPKILILFTNYGPPLEDIPLEKLKNLEAQVRGALLHGKTVHFIDDEHIPFGKLFFIRAELPHPSRLCDIGEPDDQKKQPPYSCQPANGTTNGGQKFKIEIRGGDSPF